MERQKVITIFRSKTVQQRLIQNQHLKADLRMRR